MPNSTSNSGLPGGVWLLLDASGLRTRVGLWQAGRWLALQENDAGALEALFTGGRAVLAEAKLSWAEVGGYLYVEGPGSVLGLRLAAMAIRTWQTDDAVSHPSRRARPVWSCGSLHLAAALALAGGAKPPFAICSETRQGLWNLLEVADAKVNLATLASREVADGELPRTTLFHLPARKAWASTPPHAQPLPTTLREHPEIFFRPDLLHPVETATPYSAHAPTYKKWAGATQPA